MTRRNGSGGPREFVHRLDPELVEWANSTGRTLMSDLTKPEIQKIVQQTLQAFTPFQANREDARRCLKRQMEKRANLYRQLRGIEKASGPEDGTAPHVLDVMQRREALKMLDGAQRQAIYLVFFERKTYEELAAELDVTVRYAETLLRGAIELLSNWRPRE